MPRPTCLLLDGGMASQLTSNGHTDIDADPLWSARLLSTNPTAITEAHKDFVEAGADIIETNTYQVSLEGFHRHLKLSTEETLDLIQKSVALARQAIKHQAKPVMIAGCVGPYGAALHDGSEYNGSYVDNMTVEDLKDWHRPRMQALLDAGVDMFAFETIPATKEGDALVSLLSDEFAGAKAVLSFSCKDGLHTNHGELLVEAVRSSVDCSQITHVGVNCTSPEHIESLLHSLHVHRPEKDLIVYPNSGEFWTSGRGWDGDNKLSNIGSFVDMCMRNGATIIGGCCRVTKDSLRLMREAIDGN